VPLGRYGLQNRSKSDVDDCVHILFHCEILIVVSVSQVEYKRILTYYSPGNSPGWGFNLWQQHDWVHAINRYPPLGPSGHQSWNRPIPFVFNFDYPALKVFKEGAVTMQSSSLFHAVTTLLDKKYCLITVVLRCFNNFNECPLVIPKLYYVFLLFINYLYYVIVFCWAMGALVIKCGVNKCNY